MSKVKRILSVIMAMVMVLAMSVPTFAAVNSATITVDNLDADATLSYVQIIVPDQTKETGWAFADGVFDKFSAVSGFGNLTDQQILWKLILYANPSATVPKGTTAATAEQFQSALTKVETELPNSYISEKVSGNKITAEVAGVYEIKATTSNSATYAYTPMAAFVSFEEYITAAPTDLKDVTVNAKKTTIEIEKENNEPDGVVEIGKEITYTVTTTVPYITDNVSNVTYNITDTITGAEYVVTNKKVEVTISLNGVAQAPKTADVIDNDNGSQSFVLDLKDIAKNRANANATLVITYKAIVKSERVANEVVPTVPGHEFEPAHNVLYTGKITMTKTGEKSIKLPNASFVVYKEVGGTKYYAIVNKDDTVTVKNEYVLESWTTDINTAKADSKLIVTDANGVAVVRGLDDSVVYKFMEVKAPDGYSVNTTDSTATWGTNQEASNRTGTASMTDTKLNSLPSTGGIGTTIFTIGGCAIMIVAAGLFFATRRKTQK